MELLAWAETQEFTTIWKEAAVDAMSMLLGHAQPGSYSKTDHKKGLAHWLLLHEPLPGLRLISVEFPFSYGPPRLYLRVWAYQPQGDAQLEAIEEAPFNLSGQALGRPYYDPAPPPGWKSQLKGVQIRGLRYMVDIAHLENLAPSAVGPALRDIAAAFCKHITDVCVPSAPLLAKEVTQIAEAWGDSGQGVIGEENMLAPISDAPAESEEAIDDLLADLDGIANDPRFAGLAPTERVAVANARIGQGGYRKRMVALWEGRCALSGCDVEEILIASHSLPWAQCETAHQCTDEYNGLLLSANLDRLFDRGVIAFSDDGSVLIRPGSNVGDLVPAGGLRFVHPRHRKYLAWHRRHFGFDD